MFFTLSTRDENAAFPAMSVCLSRFSYDLGKAHDPRSLLKNTFATMLTEVIVGIRYCNSVNQGHCWLALVKLTSNYIVTTMALKCNGMNHMTFISQKSPTFV
jgi:hypothetical protein